MNSSLKCSNSRFVVIALLSAVLIIVVCYMAEKKMTTPAGAEKKTGWLVYKPAKVRALATEFATYSDGDGIIVSGKPIATTLRFKDLFPELPDDYYGYTVYRLVDPDHPQFEVFLLSKRMLPGNMTVAFKSVLHKYSRNSKFLVDTEK